MKQFFRKYNSVNLLIKYIAVAPLKIINLYEQIIGGIHPFFATAFLTHNSTYLDQKISRLKHFSKNGREISIDLFTPNDVCKFRADTFSIKEPETLEWIEEFGSGKKILFDIGANVGIYSVYHCLLNGGHTVAFEPSFFNLKTLIKNVNVNNCEQSVTIIANPLSDSSGIAEFKNGNTKEGGALSAFGVDFGFDGQNMTKGVSANVMGFTLDKLKELDLLKFNPDLIKVDVDGIEHLILSGAVEILSSSECKSILVEVNDDFNEQAKRVSKVLNECGFTLREKKHGKMFNYGKFGSSFNQIWVKTQD